MTSSFREAARDPSRRAFLQASGSLAGGSWLALQFPGLLAVAEAAAAARDADAPFLHLAMAEAATLEAVAARIIPSDATPGAREAGVIHFIDQALGGFIADSAGELREGIESLDALAAASGAGRPFAELDADAQDAILRGIETTPFFGLMQFLTVAGMFSLPSYGGNRDHGGWKMLGFEHRHGWAPPFGHYDAVVSGAPIHEQDADGGHGHG
jgi:gluconate 2-dehydrogenase gamma chain